jgi:hypothetical protein
MIPDLSAVVKNFAFARVAERFLDDGLKVLGLVRRVLDQSVECGDVGIVVFAVVKLERFRGDVWL